MDEKTTTEKLEGQLSGGLLSHKTQMEWWQKQELVLALRKLFPSLRSNSCHKFPEASYAQK